MRDGLFPGFVRYLYSVAAVLGALTVLDDKSKFGSVSSRAARPFGCWRPVPLRYAPTRIRIFADTATRLYSPTTPAAVSRPGLVADMASHWWVVPARTCQGARFVCLSPGVLEAEANRRPVSIRALDSFI
jgi:hypothetical protein